MIFSGRGRYSKYIRPASIFFDLFVITVLALFFFTELRVNMPLFCIYQITGWIAIAYFSGFYEVYRYTTPVAILSKLVKQAVIFLLVVIAFFPFSKDVIFSGHIIANFLMSVFGCITVFKFLLFYYLKRYRIVTGSNFRNTVIVGYTPEAVRMRQLFNTRPDYGYRFYGFFSDAGGQHISGSIEEMKDFVIEKNIDDIYCSLSEISNNQLKDLVEFADIHQKTIKFIPDTKDILSKNLKVDYYGVFPVLSLRKTPLDGPFEAALKRFFDITFSLTVIILVLSWLTPLMALLIKLESRGPVFFRQSRPGINEQEFFCFKFRSMHLNETTEKSVTKNDPRVTRLGKFIRKTSIDELPQFLNVLLGDMSVVGPRPHLWSQNKIYSNKIKKYITRHYVKPGITGLAQVKGFRGEIETDEDMINRIKYDVFYIENWSLILDLKIITQTVVNIFQGEEKAY
jgi:putative colanic acid biosynthesis UDP-glucose lipid carrier transferase